MKTTTIKEPEFYYEWGNEEPGNVSTGCYIDGVFYSTCEITKEEAKEAGLKFHCPYN